MHLGSHAGDERELREHEVGGLRPRALSSALDDDAVVREVSRDVPQLVRVAVTCTEVTEHEVVELVRDDAVDLPRLERREEVGVVPHHDLIALGVERDCRGGHVFRRALANPARDFGVERTVLEEHDEVLLEVERSSACLPHVSTVSPFMLRMHHKLTTFFVKIASEFER